MKELKIKKDRVLKLYKRFGVVVDNIAGSLEVGWKGKQEIKRELKKSFGVESLRSLTYLEMEQFVENIENLYS